MRRVAGVLGAIAALAACGNDLPPATGPVYTTAQLALYYDSLAGELPPGDSRVYWLQQIDNAMAFGAPRTSIEIDVAGKSNLYYAVAVATVPVLPTPGLAGEVDSTYVLSAWTGSFAPISFLQASVTFVGRGGGLSDTAESQVAYDADSEATSLVGQQTVVAVQDVRLHGPCTPVRLAHLYQATGPCMLMSLGLGYQSSINGMPFRAIDGVRLTPTAGQ
jgi:hypothetical protein